MPVSSQPKSRPRPPGPGEPWPPPLFGALRQVLLATYGPPAITARAFRDIPGAEAVLPFGSWAARYLGRSGRAPNDIDVLVIGSPDRDEVDDAAERAERAIGMPVQAIVRSRSQWTGERDSFVREVKSRPLVVVLVDDDMAVATWRRRLGS